MLTYDDILAFLDLTPEEAEAAGGLHRLPAPRRDRPDPAARRAARPSERTRPPRAPETAGPGPDLAPPLDRAA